MNTTLPGPCFTPDLAGSLNNLSHRLAELHRREDALAAIEEAVTLYRQEAAARAEAFTPDLAMSLNNLSCRLAELDQRADALAASEEAVTLYRQLATVQAEGFTPQGHGKVVSWGYDLRCRSK